MSFNRTELTDAENHGASGVNRRAFFGLALASSAALALAACSSETTTTTTSGGSTSGGNSGTRTIKDIDDENVEVPANPQKVIVLSEPTLDGLLALGVTPVGSVSGRGQSGVPNYLADRAKGVQIIGTVAQVNYEQIGNLDPDLILVDSTGVDKRSETYETLKKIAPVVYCGYAGGDWRINFRNVANALNMVDKGEEVIKAYAEGSARPQVRRQDLLHCPLGRQRPRPDSQGTARRPGAHRSGPQAPRGAGPQRPGPLRARLPGEPGNHRRGLHVPGHPRRRKPAEPERAGLRRSAGR